MTSGTFRLETLYRVSKKLRTILDINENNFKRKSKGKWFLFPLIAAHTMILWLVWRFPSDSWIAIRPITQIVPVYFTIDKDNTSSLNMIDESLLVLIHLQIHLVVRIITIFMMAHDFLYTICWVLTSQSNYINCALVEQINCIIKLFFKFAYH